MANSYSYTRIEVKTIQKSNDSLCFWGLWLLFTLLYALFFILMCSYDSITFDSSYSFFLNKHSFADFFDYLYTDYSPPLYPVLLKIHSFIFGESLISLRAVSIPLFSLLFFTTLFPLRRLLGVECSILSSILLLFSSYNIYLGIEIRPTIAGFVLSTCTVIYAMLVYYDNRISDTVLLILFSVLSMYTHNVSLVFTFCIYAILIIKSIINHKRNSAMKYLICGVSVSLLYTPWLIILLHQMDKVSSIYWISDISTYQIIDTVFWGGVFDSQIPFPVRIFFISLIAIYPLIILLITMNKETHKLSKDRIKSLFPKLDQTITLLTITLLSIVFYYYAFKILLKPSFASRHFLIFYGAGTIIIAAVLTVYKKNRPIPAILSIFVIISFIINRYPLYRGFELSQKSDMMNTISSNTTSDVVFLHFNTDSVGVSYYYFPNAKHYISPDIHTALQSFDVFSSDIDHLDDNENIWQETDSFFIYNLLSFDNYDPIDYYSCFFDNENITIQVLGEYWLPYNGYCSILLVTNK